MQLLDDICTDPFLGLCWTKSSADVSMYEKCCHILANVPNKMFADEKFHEIRLTFDNGYVYLMHIYSYVKSGLFELNLEYWNFISGIAFDIKLFY